jgi:outer membrane protein TolC
MKNNALNFFQMTIPEFIKFSLVALFVIGSSYCFSQSDRHSLSLKEIAKNALEKSNIIKIQQKQTQKSETDLHRAYESYLPKITGEASYTHLNADIRLPSDLENLLGATQKLLIKEATSMQMANMAIPATYKVGFSTLYNSETDPASLALQKAITENMKDIPPIQKSNIFKANLSVQMLLFSGLKVPYTVKALNHQINANNLLTEQEKSNIICDVVKTYDQLAVIYKSEEVLSKSDDYLSQQKKFVEGAYKNGLTIDLDRQRIILAQQQLNAKHIELESSKKLLILKLNQLSGVPSESLEKIHPALSSWLVQESVYNVKERPDIKAIDEAILAVDFKKKSENTEYIPKIVAFGKKELYTTDLSTFDPKWYVGIGLRWNIFDGLTTKNNAANARIEKDILETKKNEATELLTLNQKRIQFDVEKNRQLEIVAEQQVKTAKEMFELTKKQYDAGLVTMTDYLSSLNNLETAELDMIKMKFLSRQTTTELLNSAGKLNIDNLVE